MSDLSMRPSRDELDSRRPAGPRRSPEPSTGGASRWLIVVLLLVLGGGIAWMWQKIGELEEALTASTAALQASQSELGTLQDTVQDQNQSLSKTGNQVTRSLATLDSEVRKLWDLSNKRNRPAIEALQKEVKTLSAQVAEAQRAAKEATGRLAKSDAALTGVRAELKTLAGQLKGRDTLTGTVDVLKSGQRELEAAQLSLRASLEGLQAQVDKVRQQAASTPKAAALPADIGQRLRDAEADIQAINTHRQQVNARLNRLDQDMQVLFQKR